MSGVSLSVWNGRSSPCGIETAAGDTTHFLTDEADIGTYGELRVHDEARVGVGLNDVKQNLPLLLLAGR